MCIQMYAWYVTSYTFIYVIINALRRFMFPGAGTPLALPYQEFTKEAPLAPQAARVRIFRQRDSASRRFPYEKKGHVRMWKTADST